MSIQQEYEIRALRLQCADFNQEIGRFLQENRELKAKIEELESQRKAERKHLG